MFVFCKCESSFRFVMDKGRTHSIVYHCTSSTRRWEQISMNNKQIAHSSVTVLPIGIWHAVCSIQREKCSSWNFKRNLCAFTIHVAAHGFSARSVALCFFLLSVLCMHYDYIVCTITICGIAIKHTYICNLHGRLSVVVCVRMMMSNSMNKKWK